MDHVLRSGFSFHEARLLRFAGEAPKPEPAKQPEVEDTVAEFRTLQREGIDGKPENAETPDQGAKVEKATEMQAKVDAAMKQAKNLLETFKDKSNKGGKWNQLYETFSKELTLLERSGIQTEGQYNKLLAIFQAAHGEVLDRMKKINDIDQTLTILAASRDFGRTNELQAAVDALNAETSDMTPAMRESIRRNITSARAWVNGPRFTLGLENGKFVLGTIQEADNRQNFPAPELSPTSTSFERTPTSPAASGAMPEVDGIPSGVPDSGVTRRSTPDAGPATDTSGRGSKRTDIKSKSPVGSKGAEVPETAVDKASLKPRATLNEAQRQQFDAVSGTTREMVAALRAGDLDTFTERYNATNEQLGGVDPDVIDAWFNQFMVNREGTVVISPDGTRYSFRLDGRQMTYERLIPEQNLNKPAAAPEPAPVQAKPEAEKLPNENADTEKPKPVAPEKGGEAAPKSAAELIESVRASFIEVMTQLGAAAEDIAELLPKIMAVVEKHIDTLQAIVEAGFTPENNQRIMSQPDVPSVIAEVQKIGAENGWTAELTEAVCVFFNELMEAFMSGISVNEKKPDARQPAAPAAPDQVPAAPGEKPAASPEVSKDAVYQIKDQLNKPKEMTEQERASIKDAGKKLIDEYKKIENPTKAQKEQVRGQLMMAGVDATAGVDALAKNPDSIRVKEGTEFQVMMNKVMGFVIYVMSILQEIRDTVKGEKEEENKKNEKAPELMREEQLKLIGDKTDAAVQNADNLSADGAADDVRAAAIKDLIAAGEAELALMDEGELSDEAMVARRTKVEKYIADYGKDLETLEPKKSVDVETEKEKSEPATESTAERAPDPLAKLDEYLADGKIDANEKDALFSDDTFKAALMVASEGERVVALDKILKATDGLKGKDGKTLRQNLEKASANYDIAKGGWWSNWATSNVVRSEAEKSFNENGLSIEEGEILVQTFQTMPDNMKRAA